MCASSCQCVVNAVFLILTRVLLHVQVYRVGLELLALIHLCIYSAAIGVNPATAVLTEEERGQHTSGPKKGSRDRKLEVLEAFMDYHGDHFNEFVLALTEHFMAKSRKMVNMNPSASKRPSAENRVEVNSDEDEAGKDQEVRQDDEQHDASGDEVRQDDEQDEESGDESQDHVARVGADTDIDWNLFVDGMTAAYSEDSVVDNWRISDLTAQMFKSLEAYEPGDDLTNLIDAGPHGPKDATNTKFLWNWADTIVKKSKIATVVARHKEKLDAGLGLFAVNSIKPGKLVAILSDGPVYDDRQHGDIEGKEVVCVRRKVGKYPALYQMGSLTAEDNIAGMESNWTGWMANSPSPGADHNYVMIVAKAGQGENRCWFSFLLSVTAIKKGGEIVSNALEYDDDWGVEE